MRLAGTLVALIACSIFSAHAEVVVGFSPGIPPQRTAEAVVLDAIASAKHSIHLVGYSFTSKPIAGALVKAKRAGVDVEAVLDRSNLRGKYSGAQFLANEGIPVRIDARYAIMHNKFLVIDGTAVETGSFNYTKAAAEKNAENALWLTGVPELARQYEAEWQRLWAESGPLSSNY